MCAKCIWVNDFVLVIGICKVNQKAWYLARRRLVVRYFCWFYICDPNPSFLIFGCMLSNSKLSNSKKILDACREIPKILFPSLFNKCLKWPELRVPFFHCPLALSRMWQVSRFKIISFCKTYVMCVMH